MLKVTEEKVQVGFRDRQYQNWSGEFFLALEILNDA